MIDVMIRAITRARFRQFAEAQNFIRQLPDPQGGTFWQTRDGVDIDEIGNAVVTPGTYNTSAFPPVEITPPVIDTWWLVNLRLSGRRGDDDEDALYPGETDGPWHFLRSKFVRNIRQTATVVTSPWGGQAFEAGTGTQRIQLLDPRAPQHSPKRIWAGGMVL